MGNSRSTRFIIDMIDSRLGDVEKEKKFDLIMMVVGFILMVCGIVLLTACLSSSVGLAVCGCFAILIGFAIFYVMTKEYIADCRKAKGNDK